MKEVILKIKVTLVAKSITAWDKTKRIGKAFKREAHETAHASKILLKMLRRQGATAEEKQYLKDQTTDIGKALAIIGLKIIPGSILAIIAIEKVGQKNGFTILPKEQIKPGEKPTEITNTPEQNMAPEAQNDADKAAM